jgi:mevalonate kinase
MIEASAPGKIILFGEHAVVYSRPAIAAPIHSLRAHAQIEPVEELVDSAQASDDRPPYNTRYQPDAHVAPPNAAIESVGSVPPSSLHVQAPDIGLEGWLHAINPEIPLVQILYKSLQLLGAEGFPSFRLKIQSDIPPASGLGSSAATSVAMLKAMAEYLGTHLPVETISKHAYQLEKIHHGTPSGIDNTVVAYEQLIRFVRDEQPEVLQMALPIVFVIADTGIPSPTAAAVGKVREAWQSDRDRFENAFTQIGSVTNAAVAALEKGDLQELGSLMDRNQDMLVEIGVSSPMITKLVQAARSAGSFGAKLSGAGLGGNVIALIDPQDSDQVETAMREAGAQWTLKTTIGV